MKAETFQATIENNPDAIAFVEEQLTQIGCPSKERSLMSLAVDEVFTNIVYYAYPDEEGDVTIGFRFDPETGVAEILAIDNGMPFDPLKNKDPDTTQRAEERPIGGLGIFLVKQIMDELSYERRGGSNYLSMKKKVLA